MGAGFLAGVRAEGSVGALSARAVTPVHERVQIAVLAGVFADLDGRVSARDVQLQAPVLALNEASVQLRVTPGLSLPLGSATSGLEYTLLTTGSFDPTLSVDLAVGGAWVFLAGVSGRAPLHPGFDRVRQGVYGRTDLRVARRMGGGAGFVGVSLVGQATRGFTSPGFVEVAPIAGLSVPLDARWGLELSARFPVWAGDEPVPYYSAMRFGMTRVLGKRKPEH